MTPLTAKPLEKDYDSDYAFVFAFASLLLEFWTAFEGLKRFFSPWSFAVGTIANAPMHVKSSNKLSVVFFVTHGINVWNVGCCSFKFGIPANKI